MQDPDHVHQNATRHVNTVLTKNFELPELDFIETPGYDKISSCRTTFGTPVQYVHKKLNTLYTDIPMPTGDDIFAESLPSFRDHPVRKAALQNGVHWSRIVPLAICWDGVRHNKKENFEGMQFHDLRTKQRYLSWVSLKADWCRCGCKGWCTYFALLQVSLTRGCD
jgi:hypothetical protein